MSEPSFRQELQCIKKVEHLRYILAMIVWFQCLRQDQGWWPSLPACNFQVRALATVNIEMRVMCVISQINMSLGERQVLRVLTAEMGPKSPLPGHIVHSVQSIMRPLKQTEISFMPHAVLGYSTSICLSTSIETDVSCADILSLPSSVCSAGDMPQPDDQPKDYKSAMGGMTLDSASLTGTGEQDIEDMEKNPDVETEEGRVE